MTVVGGWLKSREISVLERKCVEKSDIKRIRNPKNLEYTVAQGKAGLTEINGSHVRYSYEMIIIEMLMA